jgi:outer membrane protein OmpA-like peptidoglycan-associated protein
VAPGEKRKVEGIVEERSADSFVLRLANGATMQVKLSGETEVVERKRNFLRDPKRYDMAGIVRGLDLQVEGSGDYSGALLARKIRFTNDDYRTAQSIETRVIPVEGRIGAAESRLSAGEENAKKLSGQLDELDAVANAARGGAKAAQETADQAVAGVGEANQRISATNERITSLDDFEAMKSLTIQFKAGSATLSAEAKESLDELAAQAKDQKGFVIEVAGFASSDGNEAFNKLLSERRARVVMEYLAVAHSIPMRRIITPLGYGESHPVGDNKTRQGREDNRRAEVKILVNKGILPPGSGAKTAGDPSAALRVNQ